MQLCYYAKQVSRNGRIADKDCHSSKQLQRTGQQKHADNEYRLAAMNYRARPSMDCGLVSKQRLFIHDLLFIHHLNVSDDISRC